MLRNFAIATALLLATAVHSEGAIITWSAATNVNADSDVSTLGTLVRAVNVGSGSAKTINGVSFAANTTTDGGTSGTYDVSAGTGPWGNGTWPNYGAPLDNSNGALSADYGSALSDGTYTNGGGSIRTQTLSNLTNGQQYLIQVWWNAVQGTSSQLGMVFDSGSGTPSVTLYTSGTGFSPRLSLAQFATGTFTANATTQIVRWDETSGTGGATINMFQIRAVPEPSSFAMLLFGSVMLWAVRRKRSSLLISDC